jgi:hypothetical protein
MTKFKKGDRVELIDNGDFDDFQVGAKATVYRNPSNEEPGVLPLDWDDFGVQDPDDGAFSPYFAYRFKRIAPESDVVDVTTRTVTETVYPDLPYESVIQDSNGRVFLRGGLPTIPRGWYEVAAVYDGENQASDVAWPATVIRRGR